MQWGMHIRSVNGSQDLVLFCQRYHLTDSQEYCLYVILMFLFLIHSKLAKHGSLYNEVTKFEH